MPKRRRVDSFVKEEVSTPPSQDEETDLLVKIEIASDSPEAKKAVSPVHSNEEDEGKATAGRTLRPRKNLKKPAPKKYKPKPKSKQIQRKPKGAPKTKAEGESSKPGGTNTSETPAKSNDGESETTAEGKENVADNENRKVKTESSDTAAAATSATNEVKPVPKKKIRPKKSVLTTAPKTEPSNASTTPNSNAAPTPTESDAAADPSIVPIPGKVKKESDVTGTTTSATDDGKPIPKKKNRTKKAAVVKVESGADGTSVAAKDGSNPVPKKKIRAKKSVAVAAAVSSAEPGQESSSSAAPGATDPATTSASTKEPSGVPLSVQAEVGTKEEKEEAPKTEPESAKSPKSATTAAAATATAPPPSQTPAAAPATGTSFPMRKPFFRGRRSKVSSRTGRKEIVHKEEAINPADIEGFEHVERYTTPPGIRIPKFWDSEDELSDDDNTDNFRRIMCGFGTNCRVHEVIRPTSEIVRRLKELQNTFGASKTLPLFQVDSSTAPEPSHEAVDLGESAAKKRPIIWHTDPKFFQYANNFP